MTYPENLEYFGGNTSVDEEHKESAVVPVEVQVNRWCGRVISGDEFHSKDQN